MPLLTQLPVIHFILICVAGLHRLNQLASDLERICTTTNATNEAHDPKGTFSKDAGNQLNWLVLSTLIR